ncbi:MAG: helix-turn-helix transcriptional regulator [Actinomycetota bacterium]|nr:helix-turn-helix transcriptional regulator [Actinomycetota bacterium]
MGADEVEFGLDAEHAILLWVEQRLDGMPYRRVTMTKVAFDDDLDSALVEFPDMPEVPEASLPVRGEPRRLSAPHPRQGPPDGVLGEPVAGRTRVARTDAIVIAVDRIVAYRSAGCHARPSESWPLTGLCGPADPLELIDRRWSPQVLVRLLDGPQRFTDLVVDIPGLSRRMLTERLRELQAAGIVVRLEERGSAGAVSYALSEDAGELLEALRALRAWAATKAS